MMTTRPAGTTCQLVCKCSRYVLSVGMYVQQVNLFSKYAITAEGLVSWHDVGLVSCYVCTAGRLLLLKHMFSSVLSHYISLSTALS